MLAGKSNPPLQAVRIQSSDLEDRIDWLIDEIQRGKRDPYIRKLAGEILSRKNPDGSWVVPERDWKAEVIAIFNYTRSNVRYTRDIEQVELYQRPARSLEIGIGDCDDLTILLASLLQAVGYPVKLRVIGMKGQRMYSHIYLLVGLPPHAPAHWMALDPSRPEPPGWELPANQRGLLKDFHVEDI